MHLLQSALVVVNAMLVRSVLKDPTWAGWLALAVLHQYGGTAESRTPQSDETALEQLSPVPAAHRPLAVLSPAGVRARTSASVRAPAWPAPQPRRYSGAAGWFYA